MTNSRDRINDLYRESAGISEDDIEANRNGTISATQRRLLRIQVFTFLVLFGILGGFGLWILWRLRDFVFNGEWFAANTAAAIFLLLLGGAPFLMGIYCLRAAYMRWRDVREQQADRVRGSGRVFSRRNLHLFWMNGQFFFATGTTASAIKITDTPYTVYYGRHSHVVLSVEPH